MGAYGSDTVASWYCSSLSLVCVEVSYTLLELSTLLSCRLFSLFVVELFSLLVSLLN